MTLWANVRITRKTKEFITENINELKPEKVGLLLGTSKFLKSGKPNEFFFNRIDAAVRLYNENKIKYIIISGDNSHKSYNEPRDMKNELIKRGIPDTCIHLDYAGFRTLDSVVRAKEIFGQSSFIVISQKFHNERAVFIARKKGIKAYGYNAKDVSAYKGFKTKVRELIARDKAMLDLLFRVKPKFYGEKITIK
ncbi:protein SanA [Tenuifilaceae bacterium CYCD]|nr:protein SanA [Tenuifilaceae bacterium CYCD]